MYSGMGTKNHEFVACGIFMFDVLPLVLGPQTGGLLCALKV